MAKYIETLELGRAFFENTEQGIILLDLEDTVLEINRAAQEMFGIEKAISGQQLREIFPFMYEKDKKQIEEGAFTCKNDYKKTYKIKCRQVRLGETGLLKILYITDLTAISELQCKLRNVTIERDKIRNIIESIDEAVIVCDKDGIVFLLNRACEKLNDFSREQVIGKSVKEVYNLTEETSYMLRAIKEKKPILDVYQNYTTLLGKNMNIMCSNVPLFSGGKVVGAVSVMKSYYRAEKLTQKIMELQEQLFNNRKRHRGNESSNNCEYRFKDIVGVNSKLKQAISWSKKAALTSSPILIYGETGTGKELFAQSIHNSSHRKEGPFLAVNCAAIPGNLLEGILFGTEKGAFTGAVDRPGLFEQASGGTLFLDELNSMALDLQAKLLRVLQQNTIRRVGGMTEKRIDVRIISSMNENPAEAISAGRLRQDLYYRLGVVCIHIPPLRERKEDISQLVEEFIKRYNQKLNRNVQGISPSLAKDFLNYNWPGNVRELQHALESAMNMVEPHENLLKDHHLPPHVLEKIENKISATDTTKDINGDYYSVTCKDGMELQDILQNVEYQVISRTLQKNNGNVSKTARELGIRRQGLQYRMKKYNIK